MPVDDLTSFITNRGTDAASSAWESAKRLLGGASEQDQTPTAVDESSAMRERITRELAMNEEQLSQAVHLYSEMVNPGYFQRVAASTAEGLMQSAYAGNRVIGAAMAKSLGADESSVKKKISLQTQLQNLASAKLDTLRRRLELEDYPIKQQETRENIAALREQRMATAEQREANAEKSRAQARREYARIAFERDLTNSEIDLNKAREQNEYAKSDYYEARGYEATAKADNLQEQNRLKELAIVKRNQYLDAMIARTNALNTAMQKNRNAVAKDAVATGRGMDTATRKAIQSRADKYTSGTIARQKQAADLRQKIAEAKEGLASLDGDTKTSQALLKQQRDNYNAEIMQHEADLLTIEGIDKVELANWVDYRDKVLGLGRSADREPGLIEDDGSWMTPPPAKTEQKSKNQPPPGKTREELKRMGWYEVEEAIDRYDGQAQKKWVKIDKDPMNLF